MWAEPTPGAAAAPGGALALEALDQHGVVGHGRGVVDEPAQELIVGGGPDTELAPDGLLLGPGVPPPVPLEGEHPLLPLPQRPRRRPFRASSWGWFWGGYGGRSPPQLCVVLHVLSPAVLWRWGPGCVPGSAASDTQDLVAGRTLSATSCGGKPGRPDWRLVSRGFGESRRSTLQSGPFGHGMITGRTRFTVNGSSDPPSEERAQPPIPHRAQPVSGHWRREERRTGFCPRWAHDGPPTVAGHGTSLAASCSRPS